ncbi:MAG: S24/S26 family peptidase, partial [Terriglobales bacterium]
MDPTPNGVDANREAQRAQLAADSLRASGRLRLRVRGESMLPSLWPGDVVEIANCSAENVRPGEIVLALRDGRFYLHRFVGRFPSGGFLLRGDSMPAADPEFASEGLLGRLVSRHAPQRVWS